MNSRALGQRSVALGPPARHAARMADAEVPNRPLEQFGYRQELKRSLGLGALVVYGLVFINPTSPFSIFGVVFNLSHGMVPLVYVFGLDRHDVHRGELRHDGARLSGGRLGVFLRRRRHRPHWRAFSPAGRCCSTTCSCRRSSMCCAPSPSRRWCRAYPRSLSHHRGAVLQHRHQPARHRGQCAAERHHARGDAGLPGLVLRARRHRAGATVSPGAHLSTAPLLPARAVQLRGDLQRPVGGHAEFPRLRRHHHAVRGSARRRACRGPRHR